MPSSSLTKHNQYIEDLHHQVHDWSSDAFTVYLCAAANAPVAGNSVLADLTEITYTNLSSRVLSTTTNSQTSGTYTFLFTDLTLTASGGAANAFRYVGIYNDTPSSPTDPLIGFYDYGSDLTLAEDESLLIDWTTSTYTAS